MQELVRGKSPDEPGLHRDRNDLDKLETVTSDAIRQ
jgi:hypothetical protein